MLEKAIEARFVKECKKRGWLCLKQNVIGRRGYPDRLIVLKDGTHIWVELKTETGKLSDGQLAAIDELKAHETAVFVVYGLEEALQVIKDLE